MSDEFDKEAEREKLREKLEKDEQKRQETQRMSELLLQGATMTNEHCERCGDPLFRDGEQTFCPTCSGEASEQAAEQSQEYEQQPQSEPSQSTVDAQPSQTAEERANGAEPTPQPARTNRTEQGAGDAEVDQQPAQPAPSTTADAADPRVELQRAVTTTARKANEATDPRTAKAWLEASKEAAEALAALEQ